MRKSKERQSSEVLLFIREKKSIISIPKMWKDSHRELQMKRYHKPKPDFCSIGQIRQDVVLLTVVLLVLPCRALRYFQTSSRSAAGSPFECHTPASATTMLLLTMFQQCMVRAAHLCLAQHRPKKRARKE